GKAENIAYRPVRGMAEARIIHGPCRQAGSQCRHERKRGETDDSGKIAPDKAAYGAITVKGEGSRFGQTDLRTHGPPHSHKQGNTAATVAPSGKAPINQARSPTKM